MYHKTVNITKTGVALSGLPPRPPCLDVEKSDTRLVCVGHACLLPNLGLTKPSPAHGCRCSMASTFSWCCCLSLPSVSPLQFQPSSYCWCVFNIVEHCFNSSWTSGQWIGKHIFNDLFKKSCFSLSPSFPIGSPLEFCVSAVLQV